jgi:hypothetical protein
MMTQSFKGNSNLLNGRTDLKVVHTWTVELKSNRWDLTEIDIKSGMWVRDLSDLSAEPW